MKVLGFTRIALFAIILLGTSACSDRNYIDYRNTDEELCNKEWVRSVLDEDGLKVEYKCILSFKENGKYDKTDIYYWSDVNTSKNEFHDLSWRWADDSKERIILNNKTIITNFDNVMVSDHYLTGVLDGEEVMFTDYE